MKEDESPSKKPIPAMSPALRGKFREAIEGQERTDLTNELSRLKEANKLPAGSDECWFLVARLLAPYIVDRLDQDLDRLAEICARPEGFTDEEKERISSRTMVEADKQAMTQVFLGWARGQLAERDVQYADTLGVIEGLRQKIAELEQKVVAVQDASEF